MRVGVITQAGRIARWQAEALRALGPDARFICYDCQRAVAPRRRGLRHGAYYALNLLSVRSPATAMVELPAELPILARHPFSTEPDGSWDRLPDSLLERIGTDKPAVLLKFGTGLLRVPPAERLAVPILSYHHGDPARYRGRPAAFYELLGGERVVGQVVQILSNRLDGGAIVAYGESRVHPHSWARTLRDAYRLSPPLLPMAVANAVAGQRLPVATEGRNYRLPGNATVLRAVAKMAWSRVRRLAYGAFAEKAWRIASADLPGWEPETLAGQLEQAQWTIPRLPPGTRFLADGFFAPDGEAIVAEAMGPDGRGAILRLAGDQQERLTIGPGHCSYPAPVEIGVRTLLLPEISDWSPPRLFEITPDGLSDLGPLPGLEEERLLDATLHRQAGRLYLFGNRVAEGDGVLRLWHSDGLGAPFAEHPASPIRLSPAGARMGGRLLQRNGRLIRAGQDLRGAYGDGLLLFEVEAIGPTDYRERPLAEVRFRRCRGPHTLDARGERLLFDFYRDRLTPLAGWRRLKQSRLG